MARPVEPVPQALATSYCEWLASGKPASQWHKIEGHPCRQAVDLWQAKDAEFASAVARARDAGFEELAEEALEIANTPVPGETVTEEDGAAGKTMRKVVREDMLGHRRLQIETRLKLLACWNPKKYGPKAQLEHSGSIDLGLSERLQRARERVANRN